MGFIDGLKNNRTFTDVYSDVKNYLGITEKDKQSIFIKDAQVCPYSNDLIIYTENNVEIMRLRGNRSFNISATKSSSAVPDGTTITKGIVIGNHTIEISDACFAIKEEDLETQQKVNTTTSKARAFVGLMSKQGDNVISKGTQKLASIYQYVNGVSDLVKQANELQKKIRRVNNVESIQTNLENILFNQSNGNFQITYAGKKYGKITCISLQTRLNLGSLEGVSMKFEYTPTLDNASVKGVKVKGYNYELKNNTNQMMTNIQDNKTLFKKIEDMIVEFKNRVVK